MSTIASNTATGTLPGALDATYRLQQPTQKDRTELGQEQFLMLMITQFRNQDPLKPQDPSEFLSQLAQVTSVAGIAEMNRSVASLADSLYAGQALQAASVVGRNVLAPAEGGRIEAGGGLSGAVDLPVATQSGAVNILDERGMLVRQIPLGTRAAGLADFAWDGTDNAGRPVAAGNYRVVAGFSDGATQTAVDVLLSKRVASVSLGGDGKRTEITTADNQKLALADVRAIY